MRGRSLRVAGSLVATAALVVGCGSSSGGNVSGHNQSSAAPKTEFTDALAALGRGHAVTATLTLDTTAADLLKIDQEHGDTGPDAIPSPVADAVTSDHVTLEVIPPAGKTVADLEQPNGYKGATVSLTLGDSSQNYFSLLDVNNTLYAQLDLKYFFSVGGASTRYAAVQQQVAHAPAFVKDFIAGKWVELQFSTIQDLLGLLEGELKGLKSSIPSETKVQALQTKAFSTLVTDLTATRTSSGSTDHLVLSTNLRTLLTDEFNVLKPYVDSTAQSFGQDGGVPTPDFSQVPPTNPHIDAYVTNGTLSKISIDVGQFDQKVKYSLPVSLAITTSGTAITAPTNATLIDYSALIQAFLTAAPGSTHSSGSGSCNSAGVCTGASSTAIAPAS